MSSIPTHKEQLQHGIKIAFTKLIDDYRSIPVEYTNIVQVDGHVKGTKITVCDTVAYLIGWGRLVLKWHSLWQRGHHIDFPETGYTWNRLGDLTTTFHKMYNQGEYEYLLHTYEQTIIQILDTIAPLNNDTLYKNTWYKTHTLGRMIQLNTMSPMKNMRTKIRRFKRQYDIP